MNRFDNIDCMVGMKEYPDKYFDLAIVDPPYGVGENFAYKGQGAFKKYRNVRPNKEYFDELFRVSKNQIVWGGNYFTNNLWETNSWIIWDKNNGKSKMSDGEMAWTSFDFLLKIWKIHWTGSASLWEDTHGKIHINQKPLKLYKRCLDEFANVNDKILDTHVGSASSLIACEDMGFEYVGFEIDKDYYEAAQRRLEQFRSQLKLAI